MKSISMASWKSMVDGKEVEESTGLLVETLFNVALMDPKRSVLPIGLEQFRLVQRVTAALDKSKLTGVLELEDKDCEVIKKVVTTYIPPVWATNKEIVAAVEHILGQ